jgi:hypothetical protein
VKILTLTQPWASLVALGVKWTETRSWSTNYRGTIGIHAAKNWTRDDAEFAASLYRRGILDIDPANLPFGAILSTHELVTVLPTERSVATHSQLELGDFSPGRFVWILGERLLLPKPIPARGALGLWTFEGVVE